MEEFASNKIGELICDLLAQALLLVSGSQALLVDDGSHLVRGDDMRNENGFSLVEVLMVVAIMGIIAALAIPNLQKARQNAEASSAIQSLRTITSAEHLYYRKASKYGTLLDLAPEGTIDSALQSGSKSNYSYVLALVDDPDTGVAKHFNVKAAPEWLQSTSDYFYVDDTAVIRFEKGAPADIGSEPIPR